MANLIKSASLILRVISFSDNSPIPEKVITITATIRNDGGRIGNGKIIYYLEDPNLNGTSIGEEFFRINPGDVTKESIQWTTKDGFHRIFIEVENLDTKITHSANTSIIVEKDKPESKSQFQKFIDDLKNPINWVQFIIYSIVSGIIGFYVGRILPPIIKKSKIKKKKSSNTNNKNEKETNEE